MKGPIEEVLEAAEKMKAAAYRQWPVISDQCSVFSQVADSWTKTDH
jgi:hypothetical protein